MENTMVMELDLDRIEGFILQLEGGIHFLNHQAERGLYHPETYLEAHAAMLENYALVVAMAVKMHMPDIVAVKRISDMTADYDNVIKVRDWIYKGLVEKDA